MTKVHSWLAISASILSHHHTPWLVGNRICQPDLLICQSPTCFTLGHLLWVPLVLCKYVTTMITSLDKSQAIGDRVSAAASHVQYFPDAYTNRPTTHHLPTRTPPFHQATLTRRSRPRAPTPIPISDDSHFPYLGEITFPWFHWRLAFRLSRFPS